MKRLELLAAAACVAALLASCGGHGAAALHAVKIAVIAHGSIAADPSSAAAGAKVALSVAPEAGYFLREGSLACSAADGEPVSISGSGFTMPDSDVTVRAEFITRRALTLGAIASTPGDAASTLLFSDANPLPGQTVTITASPTRGNRLVEGSLALAAGDGSVPALSKVGELSYRFAMPDAPVAASASFESLYPIGSTGPGGGIVFYDRGSYLDTALDSWRFMELSGSKSLNGQYLVNSAISTPDDLGSGKENTAIGYAASGSDDGALFGLCLAYRGGGLSDWYLPSKDEVLQAASSRCFEDGDWHFSSSLYLDGGSMHNRLICLRSDCTSLSLDYAVPSAPGWGAYYRPARRF